MVFLMVLDNNTIMTANTMSRLTTRTAMTKKNIHKIINSYTFFLLTIRRKYIFVILKKGYLFFLYFYCIGATIHSP